jgi:hypothetical protein
MIFFFREAISMCQENIADAVQRAAGWIKANRMPGRRRLDSRYARIARAAFDDISGLAAEGFGYAAICEAFVANGLLPEGSKPYSLSRAMRREGARRQKRAESAGAAPVQDSGQKQDAGKTPMGAKDDPKTEPGKPAGNERQRLIAARTALPTSVRRV